MPIFRLLFSARMIAIAGSGLGGSMRMIKLASLIFCGLFALAGVGRAQQVKVTEPVLGELANVCHLFTYRDKPLVDSENNGSAVLYRGRYLITAAHNVHSTRLSPLTSLKVACGKSAPTEAEHVEVDVSQIRVARGYRWFPKRFSRDFAVIRLAQPIATAIPMELFGGSLAEGSVPIELAGFPGTDDKSDEMDGWTLFKASGTASSEGDRSFLYYRAGAEKGNSGGPVWTMVDGRPLVVGIHIRSSGARLVNRFFRDEVDRMISELDSAD
jgi:V8-like Glu-specific endopeptidase